jgi:hypothetical protein
MGYLGGAGIIGGGLAVLIFLAIAGAGLVFLTIRARRGREPDIRPLPAFDQLSPELGKAAEAGVPIHIGLGTGGIGGDQTLTSLAGLEVLEGIADAAVAYGVPPVVTVGDPTLLPLAQDVLRRAYIRAGIPNQYKPAAVRFIAPSLSAYALGVRHIVHQGKVRANVLAGAFQEEVALISQGAEQEGLAQMAAADHLRAVGALYPADTLLAAGEELYAGGARLKGLPKYIASLRLQDWLRFLLILVILLSIVGIRVF